MPATLPWPKIANTPARMGTASPSIMVFWAQRKRTSAWAIVRRIVFMEGSSGSLGLRGVLPRLYKSFELPGHLRNSGLVPHLAHEPAGSGLGEDRPADREPLHRGAGGGDAKGRGELAFRRVEPE